MISLYYGASWPVHERYNEIMKLGMMPYFNDYFICLISMTDVYLAFIQIFYFYLFVNVNWFTHKSISV